MGATLWVLVFANAAVIIGVIFEEDEKVVKFIEVRHTYGWLGAISLLRKRGIRTFRELGFVLLVVGLGVELLAQTASEVSSNNRLETATDAIAKLGIASDNLQGYVRRRQDALANAQKDLDNAIAAANARLAPRQLTPAQQGLIADKMRKWAKLPEGGALQRVAVFSTSGLFESSRLADQIATALGPDGAGWATPNRYPVTMGFPMAVSGIGMFASSSPRGQAVASALADALNSVGIAAFVTPQRWKGCEYEKITTHPESEPFCSSFSVEVGDHP